MIIWIIPVLLVTAETIMLPPGQSEMLEDKVPGQVSPQDRPQSSVCPHPRTLPIFSADIRGKGTGVKLSSLTPFSCRMFTVFTSVLRGRRDGARKWLGSVWLTSKYHGSRLANTARVNWQIHTSYTLQISCTHKNIDRTLLTYKYCKVNKSGNVMMKWHSDTEALFRYFFDI